MVASAGAAPHPAPGEIRLVIAASALGAVFEWYDFYVYGTLAVLFGRLFFPSTNSATGFLLALATFGVGFAVRPIGAVVFGVLGDRLGRKYTFIVTITLMGAATAAIGMLPTYASIGVAAPILLVSLRALQGFALGGEYGGASIYVAEHAPPQRRGLYTAYTQAGVPLGLILSLSVCLGTVFLMGEDAWEAWGWRIPFLVSLLLLAISLWMRFRLAESPVFRAMQAAGMIARSPLRESFGSWARTQRILAALFGISAGQAVIAYTALFQTMYFLQQALHVQATLAQLIAIAAACAGVGTYVLFGWLSDRVGRKQPILTGYLLALLLLFPLFHFIARQANPALTGAMASNPVVVTGSDCSFNPFLGKEQRTPCGRLIDLLSKQGIAYTKAEGAKGAAPFVTIGGTRVDAFDATTLAARLRSAGYQLATVTPPPLATWLILLAWVVLYVLIGMSYGPMAAWLVELFPARVRYTSLSIPYHFGVGYAGGFLPFISQFIVAKTGDPFAGLWYVIAVVAVALVVTVLLLPETAGRDLD
jgi:MFS family permease